MTRVCRSPSRDCPNSSRVAAACESPARKCRGASSCKASHPRPHQMSQPSAHQQPVFTVLEVPRVKFFALQELSATESHPPQLVLQFPGIEEQLKRLS